MTQLLHAQQEPAASMHNDLQLAQQASKFLFYFYHDYTMFRSHYQMSTFISTDKILKKLSKVSNAYDKKVKNI